MNIVEVIALINQMQSDAVISSYAIGGAVGATFYLEPISTLDVDIFIVYPREPDSLLINPKSIFDYLLARGCYMEGEYIVIAGWPVQFLPPTSSLVEEALAGAVTILVGEIPARVFSCEHLAAIALQVGRAKDKARLLQFIEADVLDIPKFESTLDRHHLTDSWQTFCRQFFPDAP